MKTLASKLAASFFLMVLMCSVTSAFAEDYTVSIRPADTTALQFDLQVAHVEMRGQTNLTTSITNIEHSGYVFLTPSETFSTSSLHILFQDGSMRTVSLVSDPTAEISQHLPIINVSGPDFTTSTNGEVFASPDAPLETRGILYLLNNLEKATPSWIRYERALPYGIQANITRSVSNGKKYVFEIEVVNTTSSPIELRASMFSDYLTEAVSITGMSQLGKYIVRPGEKNFVYVSEKIK